MTDQSALLHGSGRAGGKGALSFKNVYQVINHRGNITA